MNESPAAPAPGPDEAAIRRFMGRIERWVRGELRRDPAITLEFLHAGRPIARLPGPRQ